MLQLGQYVDRAARHNLVYIWTELYVTAWSIGRQGCMLQPGQYTDRAARHSLVNIPTELQVTTWSTYRPSCRSQRGQHTDRAAGHNVVNIPTELQVTTWSTYRPSCRSPYPARNIDTNSSTDLTHPRHFTEGSYEWCLTNVNVTLYSQISSKSFDQVRRHRRTYSRTRNFSKLPFCFTTHAIQLT